MRTKGRCGERCGSKLSFTTTSTRQSSHILITEMRLAASPENIQCLFSSLAAIFSIVLRTPKGWTGPAMVDGMQVEGTFRSHQVPLAATRTDDGHRAALEQWLQSYRPQELFDDEGRPVAQLRTFQPDGDRRMSANPVANGGTQPVLDLPDFRDYAVDVPVPAQTSSEAMRVLGVYLRDVMRNNEDSSNFRVFGPDETASNRLGAVLEETDRAWMAEIEPGDAPPFRV